MTLLVTTTQDLSSRQRIKASPTTSGPTNSISAFSKQFDMHVIQDNPTFKDIVIDDELSKAFLIDTPMLKAPSTAIATTTLMI